MSTNSELHVQMQEKLMNVNLQVQEGELSHLDALIEMRKNKEELEKSLEIIKSFENEHQNTIAVKAADYNGKYLGYEIKSVAGRKMFSFKGIEEFELAEKAKKEIEEKYKSAFEGFQKGTVQTEEIEGVRYWIDTDGCLNPFPELNIGSSFLTVKKSK